jgi:hypothetical protein
MSHHAGTISQRFDVISEPVGFFIQEEPLIAFI